MPQNIFAMGQNAYRDAWDDTQAIFDKAASRKAGRALAAGNRQGAVEAFGNLGDVDAVRTLQRDQQQADDRDYERGRQGQEDQVRVGETLLEATTLLQRLPEQDRWQVFSTHPLFQALIPEEMRAQIKPEHLSDQGLAMFGEEVKRQMVNLGGGGVAEYTPGQPLKVLREPDPKLIAAREGTTLIDSETRQPVFTKPKTYAPRASGGGGRGGSPAKLPNGFILD